MSKRFWLQAVGLLGVLVSLAWLQQPDSRVHIFFFEIAGDAMLLVTPHGRHILIDGGSDPATLASALGGQLPFWKHELDAVVLTKADRAQLAGQVHALDRYHTQLALAPHANQNSTLQREWQARLSEQATVVRVLKTGMKWMIDGVGFEVLAESEEEGAVLRIRYGRTSVIFAQNIGEQALAALGKNTPRADLLAFPWERDPRNAFVERAAPKGIVFTDGFVADHAARLTMAERASQKVRLYHERLHGTIVWHSDGVRWTITTDR